MDSEYQRAFEDFTRVPELHPEFMKAHPRLWESLKKGPADRVCQDLE